MTLNVPPIGGADTTQAATRAARVARRADEGKDFSKALANASQLDIAVPASPPAELGAEVERASARYDELRAEGRELHFASDPAGGHVAIQVRDLDGKVLRTLAPSEALDVISGAPVEEAR